MANPFTNLETVWNQSSGFGKGGNSSQPTRLFQVSAVEANVIDCVSWDSTLSSAGTVITHVLIPTGLVASCSPPYTIGDIISATRYNYPTPTTLDDSTPIYIYWMDNNIDGRTPSYSSNSIIV